MALSDVLKERLRETFGSDSQETVGTKLSMTQGNVSKLLSGSQQPTSDTLCRIAEVYGVSVDWLMGLSDKREVDALNVDKLSYEQVAQVFDELNKKNTVKLGDDSLEIKDRLLAYIMRRWTIMNKPDLNIPEVWRQRLAAFHEVRLLEYSELLEEAIDASSPALLKNEADWANLAEQLNSYSEGELKEYIRKSKEKGGTEDGK